MKVLVVGYLSFDSGKTTSGLGIISTMKERGIYLSPRKPVAGFNAWYSWEYVNRSVERGILAGGDAWKYAESSGEDVRRINPFTIMVAPLDPSTIGFRKTLFRANEEVVRLIERRSGDNGESYYADLRALEKTPETVRESVEKFLEKVRFKERDQVSMLQDVEEWWEEIRDFAGDVLIESYNDCASPVKGSLHIDHVVVSSPGKLFYVEGRSYSRAISALSSRPWTISVSEVMEVIKVEKGFPIKPGKSDYGQVVEWIIKRDEKLKNQV